MTKIRQINPFGPAVGAYIPAAATDIRATFDRQRQRIAKAHVQQLAESVNDAEWLVPTHDAGCQRAGEPFVAGEFCLCMFTETGAVFA